jgi:hypothetical protein
MYNMINVGPYMFLVPTKMYIYDIEQNLLTTIFLLLALASGSDLVVGPGVLGSIVGGDVALVEALAGPHVPD